MKALSDDEQAQKKGVVTIDYWVGCRKVDPNVLDVFRNVHHMAEAFPLRVVAVHFCYDISQIRPIVILVQNVLMKDFRLRFRTHYGTQASNSSI